MKTTACAAIVIAAPASGQGKTSITAALASFYRLQGKQVRVFKIGPDFLDPMILEQASSHPVYQLDLWMVGEQHSRALLYKAALAADIILIEGVMGLFDGSPSTADFASQLGLPVLAIIDGSAMAQTFGALAYGLANYRNDVHVKGVIANRIGNERHYHMLRDSLPADISCYGALPRQTDSSLPSRHLGLVQAEEIDDLQQRLTILAEQLILNEAATLPDVIFEDRDSILREKQLQGVRIGIAKDAAFSFIYPANLDILQQLGAEIVFFSPLNDTEIPTVDSLYFPGGYPELHLQRLGNNSTMIASIKAHHGSEKPILAECGGMLYLSDSITDKVGETADMVGLLSGKAILQGRFTALALQQASFSGGELRGHTYHHSVFKTDLETEQALITSAQCPNDSPYSEAVYQIKGLTATYIHFYFPSNPVLTAKLFTP
ncbi:cobyrinate a,c-diamide synthase [Pseudomonadota bacterium]|nr:cobyrinate a,c-diamide synthase [Pseudomonadota bacterium]